MHRNARRAFTRAYIDDANEELAHVIDAFLSRYVNAETLKFYRRTLNNLFRVTGHRHPQHVTEGELIAFCRGDHKPNASANNTVRNRLSTVSTF